VIFIHIPKAAGTSIAFSLYGKRVGHFKASYIKKKMGNNNYLSYPSFCVTRNPYDRLLSAYFYAKQGGTSEGSIRNQGLYRTSQFSSFQNFVSKWLPNQDLNKVDLIFRPQYLFVYNKGEKLVDFIGKSEDMNKVESFLTEKLKRPVKFSKHNASLRTGSLKQHYTYDLTDMVYNLYKEDFIRFGYPKELPE